MDLSTVTGVDGTTFRQWGSVVALCADLDPAMVETRAAAEDATRVIGPR